VAFWSYRQGAAFSYTEPYRFLTIGLRDKVAVTFEPYARQSGLTKRDKVAVDNPMNSQGYSLGSATKWPWLRTTHRQESLLHRRPTVLERHPACRKLELGLRVNGFHLPQGALEHAPEIS